MEKLLVILSTNQSGDLGNALQRVMGGQALPEGVTPILDNSFLIDTHTCLPFFVSLVNTAKTYQLRVAVLSVDDQALLTPDLFPKN